MRSACCNLDVDDLICLVKDKFEDLRYKVVEISPYALTNVQGLAHRSHEEDSSQVLNVGAI